MNVKDAVATRFQQICRERKLTLNELAYLSGVTPSTIYSMMDERRRDILYPNNQKILRWPGYAAGRIF